MGVVPKVESQEFDNFLFAGWKAPIADFYKEFHIERIENYKDRVSLPVLPHRRMVHFFLVVTEGSLVRSKNLSNYEMGAGDCFCLGADQISSVEQIGADVKGFYCHFKTEVFNYSSLNINFESDFPMFQIMAEPVFRIENVDKLNTLLELVYRDRDKADTKLEQLVPYLWLILTEMKNGFRQSSNHKYSAAHKLVNQYRDLLAKQIFALKSVRHAAEILDVSPNHLHKCVKETTGKGAHQLLEEMRVLEAKVLLKQSDLSISEIAYKMGQFDPSDFTRFFKKNTGLSPSQYKNGR